MTEPPAVDPFPLPPVELDPVGPDEVDASRVGHVVTVEGQVIAQKARRAAQESVVAECGDCGSRLMVPVTSQYDFLEAAVFQGPAADALMRSAAAEMGPCSRKAGRHRLQVRPAGNCVYLAELLLRPLARQTSARAKTQEPLKAHLVGPPVPGTTRVRLVGKVVVDPKSREVVLLAREASPLESVLDGFALEPRDLADFPRHFGPSADLARQVAPHITGGARDLAKRIIGTLLHTPPVIPTIDGRPILGTARVVLAGDTKTGKTELAKDPTPDGTLGSLGEWVSLETGGRTGLLYTISGRHEALLWGTLPLNDLGYVAVDGAQQMPPDELGQFLEALQQGRVVVRRALQGEAAMRVRLVVCANPPRPMASYLHPCQAIADMPLFAHPPRITRFDLYLPFSLQDVEPGEIAGHRTAARPIPHEVFHRHILWAWSRRPEQIRYSEAATKAIIEASARLMADYSVPALPIVHNGTRDTVCRFAVGVAAEQDSTDASHELVIVEESHVQTAVARMEEVYALLRLREYREVVEGRSPLPQEEVLNILKDLDETEWAILDRLRASSSTSGVLAAQLGVSVPTVKRHFAPLTRHGLVATSSRGAALAPRGVALLRAVKSGALPREGGISASKGDTGEGRDGSAASENDTMRPGVPGRGGHTSAPGRAETP